MKAPVSGSVIDLQIATGAFLNDPTAAIMTIADLIDRLGHRERAREGHRTW